MRRLTKTLYLAYVFRDPNDDRDYSAMITTNVYKFSNKTDALNDMFKRARDLGAHTITHTGEL